MRRQPSDHWERSNTCFVSTTRIAQCISQSRRSFPAGRARAIGAEHSIVSRSDTLHPGRTCFRSGVYSIADGLSLAYALRDTLDAIAGRSLSPLPWLPAQDDLIKV